MKVSLGKEVMTFWALVVLVLFWIVFLIVFVFMFTGNEEVQAGVLHIDHSDMQVINRYPIRAYVSPVRQVEIDVWVYRISDHIYVVTKGLDGHSNYVHSAWCDHGDHD